MAGLSRPFCYPSGLSLPARPADRARRAPQPPPRNPCRVSRATGLASVPFRSPLLRESRLLSLPAGTEMFHFPALPPAALCIQAAATPHDGGQVSPFGNPRITAWLPAPRGISQAPASFIGSWCQGIHRVPLKLGNTLRYASCKNRRCSRPLCSSQETDGNQPPPQHPPRKEAGPGRGPRHQTAPAPSGPNSVPTPAAPAAPLPRTGKTRKRTSRAPKDSRNE
jgi:hypothetical protein